MLVDRLTVFWSAMAVTMPLFFVGIGIKVSFWCQGSLRDGRGQPVERAKAWGALVEACRVIFSRRFLAVARVFILNGLLHRRLWHEDRYRWVCHFLMLFGFLSLFALSVITGFVEEILHKMFRMDTPLVQFITNKDTPLIAVLNEGLGVMILAGLVLTMLRRFVRRPAQLRTTPFDTSTLVLLAIIMLTSYPIESFRLLMENTPAVLARYSFLGYPLALWLKPLALNWPAWHYGMFMAHIAACIALALSMPFSKFFHVVISPIIATINSLPDHVPETRP